MIQGRLLSDLDLHQYDQSARVQIFLKLISKRNYNITKMNTSDLPAWSMTSLFLHLFFSFCQRQGNIMRKLRPTGCICYSAINFFFPQILFYSSFWKQHLIMQNLYCAISDHSGMPGSSVYVCSCFLLLAVGKKNGLSFNKSQAFGVLHESVCT